MLIEACIDGQPEVFLMGDQVILGTQKLNVFSEQSPLGVHGARSVDGRR